MTPAQLAQLAALVSLKRKQAEAELGRLRSQSDALRAEVARINTRAQRDCYLGPDTDLAAAAQFDAWATRAQNARLGMAARIDADAEPARRAMSKARGQQDAVDKIKSNMDRERARAADRRADEAAAAGSLATYPGARSR